ncbi:Ubiquitin-conjugating enzyme [Penicillium citrinum]|uniref:Ubiquitin-conjugating enzyme n=2 Tax=Penicillium TaxID=5073 RepID=A0A9W9NNK2_PENCI|nr:Ubiquitin-conjugating enzyme [Penicillium citrinum]KAJ5221934.1 Ubiquitin-conjugating enzyme [Penicillium citrinum]KAJ5596907.1 Ubiquitin-conjugating enzyme [Penicillium hetheringtonii]
MSTTALPCIPSVRRQQLHLEFASLRHAAPPGVYVSLAPGDPTLWNGVIFVRSGPYASAVLRLQIRFPDVYPDLPPLVTFATDVFHPLIVPLTTYTFSTGSASDNPVSATDEERLPPGGFSLRHGFPHWFGRATRKDVASGPSSRNASGNHEGVNAAGNLDQTGTGSENRQVSDTLHDSDSVSDKPVDSEDNNKVEEVQETPRVTQVPAVDQFVQSRQIVPVSELLEYIRSTFDDEEVLDSLPVEAAGNPGAWHAWKAHRRGGHAPGDLKRGSPQARLPGDWHWDGIWARRVQTEIEASHSDPMLYGNASRAGDDMIRFSRLDSATLDSVKEMMASVANVHKE